MGCFHPNVMRRFVSDTGAYEYRFEGGASYERADDLYFEPDRARFLVPCGKCVGCRIDRSRVWADRMALELEDNAGRGVFVTLTYDNAHLPWCFYNDTPTLNKRDCQLFMKRLRKRFPGRRIRYYLAGEYGPKNGRPHYHAILFGITMADFGDCIVHHYNGIGQPVFQSDVLADIWRCGFVSIAPCTYATCAYVARYTLKKVYAGDDGDGLNYEQVPEFSLSSRRPGIGLLRASELVIRNVPINIRCADGVRQIYLSRAFFRSAARQAAKMIDAAGKKVLDICASVCYTRSRNSVERSISNLKAANCTVSEYYWSREQYFMSRIGLLPERNDFDEANACQPRQRQTNFPSYRPKGQGHQLTRQGL